MSTVAFISHADCGGHDTGWGHPEHVGRLRAIPRALRDDIELFHALEHREARHATPDELMLAHDGAYVSSVEAIARAGGGHLDADTVVSSGSWLAATAGAGAVLDAIDLAFANDVIPSERSENDVIPSERSESSGYPHSRVLHLHVPRSFCAVRPPGHHALRTNGMGFCLFGNVAIGAHYARSKHAAERVLIVDWDVHHGNGTQALVEQSKDIHFVSMHQWPWYPGTGAASDRGLHRNVWNVPMPGGLARQRYVDAFLEAVDAAAHDFTPDLVMISAGFDSLAGDPLGGFTLELDDVDHLTREIVARAETWCGGRVVSSLEGGYVPDRLGAACVRHMRALLG